MSNYLPDPADLRWLVRSLDLGSFSAAAREQNVAVSVVTRSVDRLEAGYGVRLLRRSTHGLSATPEGSDLSLNAREVLARMDDMSASLSGQMGRVSGTVRLATSSALCEGLVVPHLAALRELHPDLRIELMADDRVIDLVTDGVDVALRSTVGRSEAVVAKKLGAFERRLYASPRYLERHGAPHDPFDLQRHAVVIHASQGAANHWPFRVDGKDVEVQIGASLSANNSSLILRMLIAGLGIGQVSTPLARRAVVGGDLVEVLPQFACGVVYSLYAVTLPGRFAAPRVRAVVAFLQQLARTEWDWADAGASHPSPA
ncbi:MAG: LysR family transcriptional regulator [Burkholderiales bacterium]